MMRHEELAVRDIMVAAEDLDAVYLSDVMRSEVSHVVATLKACGRQHALVMEEDASGGLSLRGIFSASQIARQMRIPLQTNEVARTFGERQPDADVMDKTLSVQLEFTVKSKEPVDDVTLPFVILLPHTSWY